MTGSAKRKGDHAEREAAALIHDLLGVPARRKLGAGRQDDQGDLDGIPDTTIQVAARNAAGLLEAVRHKPATCHTQQIRAGTTFGATFIRLNGGTWRVVLTPEQFAVLWREATE
jgi:hypothetical protein